MLTSEIIKQQSTLAPGILTHFGFTEMLHRNSDAVLVKLIADYNFASGDSLANLATCQFAIVTKPFPAAGTPVLADMTNEKYVVGKTSRQCSARQRLDAPNGVNSDQIDNLHIEVKLNIRIPLDWQTWMVVLNGGFGTNAFAFLVRLFWTLI